MKIGLVGGKDIKKYTIADKLWTIIAKVTELNFDFEVISIADENMIKRFYKQFTNDKDFFGFNVALPWKESFANLVDKNNYVSSKCKAINTVYKINNKVLTFNTDVIGVSGALSLYEKNINSTLIMGLGGAGFATAEYLALNQIALKVYGYDPNIPLGLKHNFIRLKNLNNVLNHKYNLIINATPRGKYYFDQSPQSFESPLSAKMLKTITHPSSIIQEMNYFPAVTPLLETANLLGLRTISGIQMLVRQALHSLLLYRGVSCSEDQVNLIIKELDLIGDKLEKDLFII